MNYLTPKKIKGIVSDGDTIPFQTTTVPYNTLEASTKRFSLAWVI